MHELTLVSIGRLVHHSTVMSAMATGSFTVLEVNKQSTNVKMHDGHHKDC